MNSDETNCCFHAKMQEEKCFSLANASQILITQGGQASRVFPVDINLIDPEFYSFYLGLIVEKKNNNKGVR